MSPRDKLLARFSISLRFGNPWNTELTHRSNGQTPFSPPADPGTGTRSQLSFANRQGARSECRCITSPWWGKWLTGSWRASRSNTRSRYAESEPIPIGLVSFDSAALPIPLGGSQVGSCFQKTDAKPIRLTSSQAAKEGATIPTARGQEARRMSLGWRKRNPSSPQFSGDPSTGEPLQSQPEHPVEVH